MGLIDKVVRLTGPVEVIDSTLHRLKIHKSYHESMTTCGTWPTTASVVRLETLRMEHVEDVDALGIA
jgi:hypothetical protein